MKNTKDYIKNFEEIEIDENEFDLIDESFNDLEKKQIKKNIRERIKVKKKKQRILKIIAIPAAIAITVGITSIPAVAKKLPFMSEIYEKLGYDDKYLNYTSYFGETVEHDGVKVTIDNIIATKHSIIITSKIEGLKEEESISGETRPPRFDIMAGMDKITEGPHSGALQKDKDGNTLMITSIGSDKEIKEKGDLKIRITFPDGYKEELSYPIDFSDSFKDTREIKVSGNNGNIKEVGIKINSIEINALGTTLRATIKDKELWRNKIENDMFMNNTILLKVGDKIYSSMGVGFDTNKGIVGYEFEEATYNNVKGENEISIIPITSEINSNEHFKLYEYMEKDRVKENDIRYTKSFEFNDGTIGRIYKIEKEDDIVRVYYKGESEKYSLLMTSGLYLRDDVDKGQGYNGVFYKDKNEENGYIAEFKGKFKEKALCVEFKPYIVLIEERNIGDEMNLSK